MKKLIVGILVLWTGFAVADLKLDADTKNVHWIFSADDAEYEHKLGQTVGTTSQLDGTVDSLVRNVFTLHKNQVPEDIPLDGTGRIEICGNCVPNERIGQVESALECEIIDDEGNLYIANNWWLSLKFGAQEGSYSSVDGTIYCFKGRAE